MGKKIKKMKKYLFEKIHFKIIPDSADKNIKTLSIQRVFPVLAIILIFSAFSTLLFLYQYQNTKYYSFKDKIERAGRIEAENQYLESELVSLKKETEKLKENLIRLNEYQRNVYNMLENSDLDLKEENLYDVNPARGGIFKNLENENSDNLVQTVEANINLIKKELPAHNKRIADFESKIQKHKELSRARPSLWPVKDNGDGYISSAFGPRSDPKTGQRAYHEGLDIAVWYNTPVIATAYGTVEFVGWNGNYGRTVIIDHDQGYKTLYAHLNKYNINKGDSVKRSEIIAFTGNTGRSTGPHLHYEVLVNSEPKNPLDYIGGH